MKPAFGEGTLEWIEFFLYLTHARDLRGQLLRVFDDVVRVLLNLTKRFDHFCELAPTDGCASLPQLGDFRVQSADTVIGLDAFSNAVGVGHQMAVQATRLGRHCGVHHASSRELLPMAGHFKNGSSADRLVQREPVYGRRSVERKYKDYVAVVKITPTVWEGLNRWAWHAMLSLRPARFSAFSACDVTTTPRHRRAALAYAPSLPGDNRPLGTSHPVRSVHGRMTVLSWRSCHPAAASPKSRHAQADREVAVLCYHLPQANVSRARRASLLKRSRR
jgi:hypothetical protein